MAAISSGPQYVMWKKRINTFGYVLSQWEEALLNSVFSYMTSLFAKPSLPKGLFPVDQVSFVYEVILFKPFIVWLH